MLTQLPHPLTAHSNEEWNDDGTQSKIYISVSTAPGFLPGWLATHGHGSASQEHHVRHSAIFNYLTGRQNCHPVVNICRPVEPNQAYWATRIKDIKFENIVGFPYLMGKDIISYRGNVAQ